MINSSDIRNVSFNSSFLRKILSLRYKEGHFYKILFGANRGARLYYQKNVNFHAILGLWEAESFSALTRLMTRFGLNGPNKVIADVGGNIGYYSIFFSKNLDATAKIFVFEPSREILPVLRKNLMVNGISNVKILELACADHTGNDEFFIAEHHHQSSLVKDWSNNATKGVKTVVATITLDDYFERFNQGRYPDLIKMDIEGGGIYALKGCARCIAEKQPFILIESHTAGEDLAVGNLLREFNYEAFRLSNQKWIIHKDKNYKDPDGVWGTMLLMPAYRKAAFIK